MSTVTQKDSVTYPPHNNISLIRGGKDFFELMGRLIGQATASIHLQTYIFNDDETGLMVAEWLKAAARRNVQVYLLADGYASQWLSHKLIADLREAGVHFRFFEPFLKSKNYYFGRRLHHKVFVADAKFALVGGINIADRYNDMPGEPAWLDFALLADGTTAVELCVLCWKSWNGFSAGMGITPCEKEQMLVDISTTTQSTVQVKRNDWVRRKNQISSSYIDMFRNAQSHITILCSYFLPGRVIRRLLRNASKRGVKIKLITAGPSDIRMAKYAERWMYDWLLRNNIDLYEYQPVVLHAKVAVCDDEWFTLGSYNVNNISAYASIELNIDVHEPVLTGNIEQLLGDIIQQDCIHITKAMHARHTNIFKQFIRWCSYEFIRVVFYLITFYYKQSRFEKRKRPVNADQTHHQ